MNLSIESLGDPVRKKGNQYFYNCPFHEDDKGHLGVEINKGIYHCFKCNASGKILSGSITLDQFKNKVEKFIFGSKEENKNDEDIKVILPKEFREVTPKSGMPYRYLRDRELTDKQISQYGIGYCSDGPYEGRVIIPIYEKKELKYFVGRSFTNVQPKYMNSPIPKKGIIFKTFNERVDRAIICEGIFDALRISNMFPAISLLGKVLVGIDQVLSISKATREAYVLLDSDADKDSFLAYMSLNMYIPTKVMFLPGNIKDPGELTMEELKGILPR